MIIYKIVRESEGVIRQIAPNKTANNLIGKDISPNVSLASKHLSIQRFFV